MRGRLLIPLLLLLLLTGGGAPAHAQKPAGAFDYAPTICEGTCNAFIDMSQGEITRWEWSFPGAVPSTSTERHPRDICYARAGSYPVTLVVWKGLESDTVRKTVVVRGQQLALDSAAHPVISRIQLDTTLLSTTRCDSIVLHNRGETSLVIGERDARMLSGRSFAIAPGQYPLVIPPHRSRGLRICYTPSAAGEEHDGLVLVDSCLTIVAYLYATGWARPPAAAFGAASPELCRRECLDFTDMTSGVASAWRWSFPGAVPDSSTEPNPRAICFPAAGEYLVTLIATNIFGADTIVRRIIVEGTPRPEVVSSLDSGAFGFGGVGIGLDRWDSVMIRAGVAPVTIGSARLVGNTAYSIPPSQFPLTIPAGTSRALRIGYAPSGEGEEHDTLLIAGDCGVIVLPLAGRGISALADALVCSTRLSFRSVTEEGYLRVEAPYPNPASARVRVPVDLRLPAGVDGAMRCVLHDPLGRTSAEGNYAGWRSGDAGGMTHQRGAFTIDVSGLASGAYYATIIIGENVTTIPVLVGR